MSAIPKVDTNKQLSMTILKEITYIVPGHSTKTANF
jgi:hypothetical protein